LGWGGFGFRFSKMYNAAERYWRWLSELERIRGRLSGVVIECDDFEKVIRRWDGEDVFFLFRSAVFSGGGGFSVEDYERLLRLLKGVVKGKWLLSGYGSELYDRELRGYNRFEFDAVKHSYYKVGSGRGFSRPRVREVLWCNYEVGRVLSGDEGGGKVMYCNCLLYTSPSPRD